MEIQKWEIEFGKQIGIEHPDYFLIKDFISSLLEQEKIKMLEEVEESLKIFNTWYNTEEENPGLQVEYFEVVNLIQTIKQQLTK
jgi:uncharacterized ubiquitin-like protein YukD